MSAKRWIASFAIAGLLSLAQTILTPYLTYHGRGVPRALLSEEQAALFGPMVFLLVLAASAEASTLRGSVAIWHCCFRGSIWAAILSSFFFQIVCCCALRFQEVPPSGALHWHLVFFYFGLVWAALAALFIFRTHLRSRAASRSS